MVVGKNVWITERFFDNHYKQALDAQMIEQKFYTPAKALALGGDFYKILILS